MRSLSILSGALAGLLMIVVGGFIPAATIIPSMEFPTKILDLPTTWQVPALLVSSLVSGPSAGIIAAVAYITIGLFYLPIFNEGGSVVYLINPAFGYLFGFIPAAWIAGRVSQRINKRTILNYNLAAIAGLIVLQSCGLINLIIGFLLGLWSTPLPELIFKYSLAPLPSQLLLCPAIAIISLLARRLLFLE